MTKTEDLQQFFADRPAEPAVPRTLIGLIDAYADALYAGGRGEPNLDVRADLRVEIEGRIRAARDAGRTESGVLISDILDGAA